MLRRLLLAVTFVLALPFAPAGQEAERFQPPVVALPPTAERIYRTMSTRVNGLAAMDVVRYMDQYWRVAGNPGYNNSIDFIRNRLQSLGYAGAPD